MATKRAKINKTLEKAKKLVSKKNKKTPAKRSYPDGQNAPQSKVYTMENDKLQSAKNAGWRFTKEGAKKLGKSPSDRPTTSEIEKYRNETFKVKGKSNKSGPRGTGDGSYRYIYIERRADKSDLNKARKLELGGYNPDEMLKLKIEVDVYEDDYMEGEGKKVNSYKVNTYNDPNVKASDLVKYLSEEFHLSENPNDYTISSDGYIYTDQLVDADGVHVNDKATLERWKRGEKKLYNAHYTIYVLAVKNRKPSVDELSKATGIGTYAKGGVIKSRFKIGDKVQLSESGWDNENYHKFFDGKDDVKLVVTDVYKSKSEHPGFDDYVGLALYSTKRLDNGKEVPFDLYEYELDKVYEDGGYMAKGGKYEDLRKRFEGYTDEELQIFNGDNKETLKHWNRKDAIEDAIKSTLDEQDSHGNMAKGGEMYIDLESGDFRSGIFFDPTQVREFEKYVFSWYGKNGVAVDDMEENIPATTAEVLKAVSQYLTFCNKNSKDWGGGDSFDREVVHDIIAYNRNPNTTTLFYESLINKMKKTPILEYGGILQPMIGGVNADPRFDIYNVPMFAEKGAEVPDGEKMERGGIFEVGKYYKKKDGSFYRYLGNGRFMGQNGMYKELSHDDFFAKGGKLSDTFKKAYDYGDREGYIRDFGSVELEVKGKDKEIKLVALAKISNIYDATGDEQFEKTPYEVSFEIVPTLKHIDKKHIDSAMDSSGVDELSSINYGDIFESYMSGVPLRVDGETFKLFATYDEAKDYIYSKEVNDDITVSSRLVGFALDRPVNRIGTTGWSYLTNIVDENHDPYKFAKGGSTHEQGYDDREDERLAMRRGKIASKDFVGSHKRREHSRRDDAHFETRK